VNVDGLARLAAQVTASEFKAQHGEPALVFLVPSRSEDQDAKKGSPRAGSGLSDPLEGTARIKTDTFRTITKKLTMSETQEGEQPSRAFHLSADSEIVFLKKTDRNPFLNMVTVGRSPNNDVWIALPSVSKFHACFSLQKSGWTITDQKATNETRVEGKPLRTGATLPVTDGVTIDFGPDVRATLSVPRGLSEEHGPLREIRRT